MWDEFCATSAYLHNLTNTSANNGKSSYELWHSYKPPLLHLHEIGCYAFSLITTNNPKILHCSIPCIFIDYAPNAKAYQLWDPTTNHIFNFFHVSFIETCQLPVPPPPSNNIQDSLLPTHSLPNTINNHPTPTLPITSSASDIPITNTQHSTIPYPI